MSPSELSDLFDLADFVVQRPARDPAAGPWTIQERAYPRAGALSERIRFALGYAILAPSIRNSQPWRFRLRCDDATERGALELRLDRARVPVVADPEGRAATISCGAALATLTLALSRLELPHAVTRLPDGAGDRLALVRFDPALPRPEPLAPEEQWMFQCVGKRRTMRGPMAARPLAERLTRRFRELARASGAELITLAPEDPRRAALVELIEEGEALQSADPRFVDELARWTLSPGAASEGRASGLRRAPGLRTFTVLREDGARAARGEELSDGSPVMAILTTEGDAPGDWLRAGAALVRVLLRGRVDHVWASFFGQPLERPELRARLGEVIRAAGSAARWPQVALRLGHGGEVPPSPRRDVAAVLEQDDEELV